MPSTYACIRLISSSFIFPARTRTLLMLVFPASASFSAASKSFFDTRPESTTKSLSCFSSIYIETISSILLVHFSLFQPVPICHSREGGNPRYYLHTLDSRLRGNDTKHVSPIQLEIGN